MLSVSFSPFPIIETERLLLRCINIEDAPQLFLLRSDPEIMKYLDREPHLFVEETAAFIKEKILDSLHKNEGILRELPHRNRLYASRRLLEKRLYERSCNGDYQMDI